MVETEHTAHMEAMRELRDYAVREIVHEQRTVQAMAEMLAASPLTKLPVQWYVKHLREQVTDYIV